MENKETKEKPKKVDRQIWLSVSESAKFAGVESKTIRRAIKSKSIRYKVAGNRYAIKLSAIIEFSHGSPKIRNKFYSQGLGQYVEKFKKNFLTK